MSEARTGASVGLASLFVYAISFLNQILLARTLGTSVRADAYAAGNLAPLMVMNLTGAVFTYAAVPHLIREGAGANRGSKQRVMLIRGFILGLIIAAAGGSLHVFSLNAESRFGPYGHEAVLTAIICWITAPLMFVMALSDAVFNRNRHFLFPVLAFVPAYVLTAIATLGFAKTYGGPVLAVTVLAGYLAVLPLRFLHQRSEFSSDGAPPDDSLWRSFVRAMPLTLAAVSAIYAFPAIDTWTAAGQPPGALAALGYSSRLVSMLAVVLALGPFGVLVPKLSQLSADGDHAGFLQTANRGVLMAASVLAPVTMVIWLLRAPLIRILFERGDFSAESTTLLANVLTWTLPGGLFTILSMLIMRFLLADHRIKESALLSGSALAIYIASSLVLRQPFGYLGIAASTLVSGLLFCFASIMVLRRPHRRPKPGDST